MAGYSRPAAIAGRLMEGVSGPRRNVEHHAQARRPPLGMGARVDFPECAGKMIGGRYDLIVTHERIVPKTCLRLPA